jgi:hypothetical protein
MGDGRVASMPSVPSQQRDKHAPDLIAPASEPTTFPQMNWTPQLGQMQNYDQQVMVDQRGGKATGRQPVARRRKSKAPAEDKQPAAGDKKRKRYK